MHSPISASSTRSASEKFDPEGKFIRRYLPQLAGAEQSRAARALAKP